MNSIPSHPDQDPTPEPIDRLGSTPIPLHLMETLVRFDEASKEDLLRIEAHPVAMAVLRELRRTDRFLKGGGLMESKNAIGASTAPMIPADQLFAFGHGELDADRSEAVRQHLAARPHEGEWVAALKTSPPPGNLTWDREGVIEEPEEDFPDADEESPASSTPVLPGPGSTGIEGPRSAPGWLAWTPLAAAALVLAMALSGSARRSALEGGLPDSPVLRSAAKESLLFPRGRVIAGSQTETTYANRPLFEVTPVAGASAYTFELRDVSNSSAFAEGKPVWAARSSTHNATAAALAPGSYTWTAQAVVNGIERSLGSLSFTVVPRTAVDSVLLGSAATDGGSGMPGSIREDVRRLHALGFLTDARDRARALPPGTERDAYLTVPSTRDR